MGRIVKCDTPRCQNPIRSDSVCRVCKIHMHNRFCRCAQCKPLDPLCHDPGCERKATKTGGCCSLHQHGEWCRCRNCTDPDLPKLTRVPVRGGYCENSGLARMITLPRMP